MYMERRSGATLVALALHLFQLGVALDEFLCAPSGKTDGEAPVLVVPFNADDGADTVTRIANLPAEKRGRVGRAPRAGGGREWGGGWGGGGGGGGGCDCPRTRRRNSSGEYEYSGSGS